MAAGQGTKRARESTEGSLQRLCSLSTDHDVVNKECCLSIQKKTKKKCVAFTETLKGLSSSSSSGKMDVSTASPNVGSSPWPPALGPSSLTTLSGNQEMLHARFPPPPVHLGIHPRMGPSPQRLPLRPFFVREIYKNGFLKRLAPNEKKSSALSKLMRSDRYWVVFSVHDLGAEQVSHFDCENFSFYYI